MLAYTHIEVKHIYVLNVCRNEHIGLIGQGLKRNYIHKRKENDSHPRTPK